MTITVFGANGGIGSLLVKQALEKGYQVRAYVRESSKFDIAHPNLTIFRGDLYAFNKIESAISGTNAVISTLGPSKRIYNDFAILAGHKNIIESMEKHNVKRLITIATLSVKSKEDKPSLITRLSAIMASIIHPSGYKELVQVGSLLQTSTLDWTIVRFLMRVDGPQTDNISVSFGDKKIKWKISRADIASFILSQLEEKQYIRSMPIIGS